MCIAVIGSVLKNEAVFLESKALLEKFLNPRFCVGVEQVS